MVPFKIDSQFLDALSPQARMSERKRMHYDLRDSADEDSMRMLNAVEPETVIPIHRHTMTSEDVVALRGCVEEVLYSLTPNPSPKGEGSSELIEVARVRLEAGTDCVACHVPKGQYHTCISLASGSVFMEFKATKYDAEKSEELL